jgi:hypothetical protein
MPCRVWGSRNIVFVVGFVQEIKIVLGTIIGLETTASRRVRNKKKYNAHIGKDLSQDHLCDMKSRTAKGNTD